MPTIPPPPGDLVDVGGYGLHLQRQGRGSPPVVLEAALGDCSLSWALVQPRVASFTTVYGYDRAGLAWSDTGPNPRTSTMVAELHDLLRAAAVEHLHGGRPGSGGWALAKGCSSACPCNTTRPRRRWAVRKRWQRSAPVLGA
jgi:pimeloyl-ACP methyl ester carboxylesterase